MWFVIYLFVFLFYIMLEVLCLQQTEEGYLNESCTNEGIF